VHRGHHHRCKGLSRPPVERAAQQVDQGRRCGWGRRSGGRDPQWGADGKALFYVATDSWMMAVKVTTTAEAFRAEVPERLFKMPTETSRWDVRRDGQRFLLTVADGKNPPPPFKVILNWQAGLKK